MKIVVGSANPSKIKAAQLAVSKLFPKIKVVGIKADSKINRQPQSDKEAIKGAINRAKEALKKSKADFGIGMEGGMNRIGKFWFECGWIAVTDKKGKTGLGSSARFLLSQKMVEKLRLGKELDEVVKDLTGIEDVGKMKGVMGLVTKGRLSRAEAYSQGVIFAFAPFISDKKFWD